MRWAEDNRGQTLAIDGAYTEAIKDLSGPADADKSKKLVKNDSAVEVVDLINYTCVLSGET